MSQQPPQPPRQQKQQYSLWDEASLQVALTQEGIDIRGVRTRAELDALAAAVLPHAVSCGRVAPPAHLLGGNGGNGGENGGGNGAGGGGAHEIEMGRMGGGSQQQQQQQQQQHQQAQQYPLGGTAVAPRPVANHASVDHGAGNNLRIDSMRQVEESNAPPTPTSGGGGGGGGESGHQQQQQQQQRRQLNHHEAWGDVPLNTHATEHDHSTLLHPASTHDDGAEALSDMYEDPSVHWVAPDRRLARRHADEMHPRNPRTRAPFDKRASTGRHCVFGGCGDRCDPFREETISEFLVFGVGIR
jgi:hypothetical protein